MSRVIYGMILGAALVWSAFSLYGMGDPPSDPYYSHPETLD